MKNSKTGNTENSKTKTETEKDRNKQLQKALNKDFNLNLKEDGIIGEKTTEAVTKHYLKYYTTGEFVGWTQKQLERKGYSVGKCGVDKKYGRDTESATKKYQKEHGLVVDGKVGIKTVKSLTK